MRKKELTNQEKEDVMKLIDQGIAKSKISKMLHIDYRMLKRFFDENDIPNKKMGIQLKDYEPIFNLYLSGLTLQQIHDNYYPQYTSDQINYICREKGITRPNGKVAILNHNYFDNIDSEEKAYFLGLLTADGNIQHHIKKGNSWTITLELMKDDKYLVEQFGKAVESDKQVKEYVNNSGFQKKNGKPHVECRLTLSSSHMAKTLIEKYGIVPNKSLVLNILPQLSDIYMPHYIRGYMDGNGSITYHTEKYGLKKPRILIYGTHEYCDKINHYITSVNHIKENKIYDQKKEQVSFIGFNTINDIEIIYGYLYSDATIYMKRKKEKLEKLISEYRDNHIV